MRLFTLIFLLIYITYALRMHLKHYPLIYNDMRIKRELIFFIGVVIATLTYLFEIENNKSTVKKPSLSKLFKNFKPGSKYLEYDEFSSIDLVTQRPMSTKIEFVFLDIS